MCLPRGPISQQLTSGPLYLSSCQVDLRVYISAAATWTYISAAACQHTVVLTGSHHRGNCIVMFSATLSDSPHAVHASDDSNFLIVRPIAQSSVISCVRMYCIYVYCIFTGVIQCGISRTIGCESGLNFLHLNSSKFYLVSKTFCLLNHIHFLLFDFILKNLNILKRPIQLQHPFLQPC